MTKNPTDHPLAEIFRLAWNASEYFNTHIKLRCSTVRPIQPSVNGEVVDPLQRAEAVLTHDSADAVHDLAQRALEHIKPGGTQHLTEMHEYIPKSYTLIEKYIYPEITAYQSILQQEMLALSEEKRTVASNLVASLETYRGKVELLEAALETYIESQPDLPKPADWAEIVAQRKKARQDRGIS